jgi:hypothetical protein
MKHLRGNSGGRSMIDVPHSIKSLVVSILGYISGVDESGVVYGSR